jgi:hypothetical protein
MSSLPFAHAISALPRGILVAGGAGIVFVLLLLWLVAHLSRRRVVIIGESESIRTAIVQLARVADSLERLSLSLQSKLPAEGEAKEAGKVFSGFSR